MTKIFIRSATLLFSLASLLSFEATAQKFSCGTTGKYEGLEELRQSQQRSQQRVENQEIKYFPIRLYIVKKTTGEAAVSQLQILKGITTLNEDFLPAGVQFYVTGPAEYIVSDRFYDYKYNQEDSLCKPYDVENAINMYFVNRITYSDGSSVSGYAYYPGSLQRAIITGSSANSYKTLSHEMGHYFSLAHTFRNSDHADIAKRELVTRGSGRNCETEGDGICDTPADPYPKRGTISNCVYEPFHQDVNGDFFSPDILNLMSYYNEYSCGKYHFSPGQISNIRLTTGSPWRTVLTYPAQDVAAPTQLSYLKTENGVKIRWKDNAANEIGYFIERSLDPDSGFVQLNAVEKDTVTYTDIAVQSNTTYYYRIRAANSLNYSTVLTVAVGLNYCRPVYTSSCSGFSPETGVKTFTISTSPAFVSNSEACNDNHYSISALPLTLKSGATYPVEIKLDGNGSYFAQHATVWIDLNLDGAFTREEQVFATTANTTKSSTISGSMTVPGVGGTVKTRMRLRTGSYNNGVLTDACATMSYGETEDYEVTLQPSPLGLNDDEGQGTQTFYPNPASDKIQLTRKVVKAEILDLSGLTVSQVHQPGQEMDLSDLSEGVYLLKLTDAEGRVFSERLIRNK